VFERLAVPEQSGDGSSGLFSLAPRGLDGLLPLLIGQDFAVRQLAEMFLDKGKLRVSRTPYELAGLFDDALVVLADDLRWARTAEALLMPVNRAGAVESEIDENNGIKA
jgi:hypothetical protein